MAMGYFSHVERNGSWRNHMVDVFGGSKNLYVALIVKFGFSCSQQINLPAFMMSSIFIH